MRRAITGLCIIVFSAAGFAFAQQSAAMQDSVAEIHVNQVKPGMAAQYEAGRKKHMAWHKSQNDSWSWEVYEIVTGESTGSYYVGTFGHPWKDFDTREKFNLADSADAMANMGSSMAREEMSYYVLRRDLSMNPDTTQASPFNSITHFMLSPSGTNDFVAGVKKVNEALKKANEPSQGASRWYQLANGGFGPHFVLVGDRAAWAAFQSPSNKSLDEIMAEAYGKEEGAAIMKTTRSAIQKVYSEAIQYRPDLSYHPGK